MPKCACGCGGDTKSQYVKGHHWRAKRAARGVPESKTCEWCHAEFTRAEVGQNEAHWMSRRYCSDGCVVAAHEKVRRSPKGTIYRCSGCGEYKPRGAFWTDRANLHGIQGICKACRAVRYPSRTQPFDAQKRVNLKRYGITLEEYELMHSAQGGVCAICEKPETARNPKGGVKSLAVDHCHTTGRVRALLCQNCNRGIGHLQESPELLSAASQYLAAHAA